MRRIEGYVIVSSDGMLADGRGHMPDSIRNDADQNYFQSGLDKAVVIVHGRHSHEGGPHADSRKRLVVTRQVAALSPNTDYPNALSWNPVGATLDEALKKIGVADGTVAVIGGPEVFSLFLPLYDAFHLSRAEHAKIPDGLHPFVEAGPNTTPEDVLTQRGFKPGPRRTLDAAAGISVVTWTR